MNDAKNRVDIHATRTCSDVFTHHGILVERLGLEIRQIYVENATLVETEGAESNVPPCVFLQHGTFVNVSVVESREGSRNL